MISIPEVQNRQIRQNKIKKRGLQASFFIEIPSDNVWN